VEINPDNKDIWNLTSERHPDFRSDVLYHLNQIKEECEKCVDDLYDLLDTPLE
jgi:hypothetical protein